jgi:hypothetical protein
MTEKTPREALLDAGYSIQKNKVIYHGREIRVEDFGIWVTGEPVPKEDIAEWDGCGSPSDVIISSGQFEDYLDMIDEIKELKEENEKLRKSREKLIREEDNGNR